MIFLWKKHNNFVVLFELWRHKKIANKRKSKRDTRKEITTESTRRIVVKYSSYLINLQRYQRQNYIFVVFFLLFFHGCIFAIMEPKKIMTIPNYSKQRNKENWVQNDKKKLYKNTEICYMDKDGKNYIFCFN